MDFKAMEEKYARKYARREAQTKKRAELRAKNRAKTLSLTRASMTKLLKLMKDSGYNRLKLSGYSGVSPASVSRLTLRRNIDSVRFSAVVGLARASGYKIEFVRLSPEEDDFYDDRWLRASDVYGKEGDKGSKNAGK